MKQIKRSIFLLVFLTTGYASFSQTDKVIHTVYYVGDAGEPGNAPENFALLKQTLDQAPKRSTLVFLGDNIYPHGLPDKDHPKRNEMEAKLNAQFETAENFKGKVIVMPGNHDWANGRRNGLSNVKNQTKYTKKYFDSKKAFFPKDGYPGPEEVKIADGVYMIIFDLQWMIHRWKKPLEDHPLEHHEALDVLVDIGSLLEKHKNDHVIVAAHHPMYSYGLHGGKYSLKHHIFPLTDLNKALYLPLPIIGSLYPTYRSTAGASQDIPHPKYKAFRTAMEEFLVNYPNVYAIGGHEHSLQHIKKDGVNYIVSGSGSKATYTKEKGKYLQFAKGRKGFAKVDYYESGKVDLEFFAADENAPTGKSIYKADLYQKQHVPDDLEAYPNYHFEDSVRVAVASHQYTATPGKNRYMGENYRAVWELPVEAPIFNISEEHGGLEIIKKGGGLQTNSLRMEANNGKQYVLRSVEKYPDRALPPLLRKTFAENVVQDQISASHPYVAYIVPPMAEAVGVYHTNPKLVYVPDDGALGKYRETFKDKLALYEERPAKDWSEATFFGNSADIVNTQEVLDEVRDDNDNSVDQRWVLKSRLFDMIIADWDRHEDQWRWASFEGENGMYYRPIPRDRDQAFFVNDGVFPKIASRKWAIPKVEGFNEDVRWSPGLNFNARYFDRLFMSQMSRQDWIDEANKIKENLTDEVIEEAVSLWPQNVYELTGKSSERILKARRDNLERYALELYDFLAKEVEIRCTEKTELVQIHNVNSDEVKITVNKIAKDGDIEQEIYKRSFFANETDEVRIYGFDNDDQFKIIGNVKSKVKVRIIGGKGKDEIYDNTESKSAGNVYVYDKKSTKLMTEQTSFKSRISDNKDVNAYDKYGFQYDILMPLAAAAFNKDDGVFIGGGFLLTQHGWRKYPYKNKQSLIATMAFGSRAFNIKYNGEFVDVLGSWNLDVLVDIKEPFSVDNYFGMGNESFYDTDRHISYYRVRMEDNTYRLTLSQQLGAFGKFSIGPIHRGVEVIEQNQDKFISSSGSDLEQEGLFETDRYYTGGYMSFEYDTRDEPFYTTRGMLFKAEGVSVKGWNQYSSSFSKIKGELGLYYSFKFPPTATIAYRIGAEHNIGDFEFYNASKLGGRSNMRGFRRTRFYGRSAVYSNVDLRLKLVNFNSYLLPGKIGIHGFYDVGRVWQDDETSHKWHRSGGAGVWIAPLSKLVVSFSLAFSNEENLPFVDLGFFF